MQNQKPETIQNRFNFIKFDDILIRIRDSFIDEVDKLGLSTELRLNGRLFRKILKHCVLEETLKSYSLVDFDKINVIIINPEKMYVVTGELFDSREFCNLVIRTLDASKRKIPILIKKYSNELDIHQFIHTGDGEQYLMSIVSDRTRLRKEVCSFKEFKLFAKKNHLKYIAENMLDDINFKKLFIS